MEIATLAQAPAEPCNIHGEPRARLARELGSSDLPRAELAVNLTEVAPVAIKSPTLIADRDPYNSIKPTLQPEPTLQPGTDTAENSKPNSAPGVSEVKPATNPATQNQPNTLTTQSAPEIRKAIPVSPIPKAIPVQPQDGQPAEIRRAVPVKPLDGENGERTLLRSAAQPPGDIDE